jgi:RNA polymerase sigma-70 factor, ECF subfamily
LSIPGIGQAPSLDFTAVFSQHSRFVWRVLARLGVKPADLPDVCQEVFLVVHRRLAQFDPSRAALGSWMYGICLRVASEYRRGQARRREISGELVPVETITAHQFEDVAKRRAWLRLERVLNTLDANQRESFVLYELEALPMSEIAEILNCPIQTAYARLHAARRAVLSAFEGETES